MRTSKFSEEQIIGILRQAEAGMPNKENGRKHGFSDASFYKWRSKYGGKDASKAKRLLGLELENGKLKRLLAEQLAWQQCNSQLKCVAKTEIFGRRYELR